MHITPTRPESCFVAKVIASRFSASQLQIITERRFENKDLFLGYFLCFRYVPLSCCMSRAGIRISFRYAQILNGFRWNLRPVITTAYGLITFWAKLYQEQGTRYDRKFESTSNRCCHVASDKFHSAWHAASAGLESPSHTCGGGGILWLRAVFSCVASVIEYCKITREFRYPM